MSVTDVNRALWSDWPMGRHASRSSSGPIPGSVLRAGVGQSPGILALGFKLLRLLALARARLLAGWRAVVVQPVIHTHTHIHTGLVHGGAGWMDGWMDELAVDRITGATNDCRRIGVDALRVVLHYKVVQWKSVRTEGWKDGTSRVPVLGSRAWMDAGEKLHV